MRGALEIAWTDQGEKRHADKIQRRHLIECHAATVGLFMDIADAHLIEAALAAKKDLDVAAVNSVLKNPNIGA